METRGMKARLTCRISLIVFAAVKKLILLLKPVTGVIIGAHLANMSYRQGKRIDWDPVNQKFA